MRSHSGLVVLGLVLATSSAWATPVVVSVDLDPDTAGVQAVRTVRLGDRFEVRCVVANVSPQDPLQGFDVQLAFEAPALRARDARHGDFLPDPVRELENVVAASTVDLAALSMTADGVSGAGVLATFQFESLTEGETALDISGVLLSGRFGNPIPVRETLGARITVPAPEPSAHALLALAILVAGSHGHGTRSRRAHRGG